MPAHLQQFMQIVCNHELQWQRCSAEVWSWPRMPRVFPRFWRWDIC